MDLFSQFKTRAFFRRSRILCQLQNIGQTHRRARDIDDWNLQKNVQNAALEPVAIVARKLWDTNIILFDSLVTKIKKLEKSMMTLKNYKNIKER